MTIEEFRQRINSGPTAEELREGFEQRIIDIINKTIDEREDFKNLKTQIAELEKKIENFDVAIVQLEEKISNEKKQ